MNFLDTVVKINQATKLIYTDLYTKDTDTHNYLHYSSSHPRSNKNGGPFGEFLRIRRNCYFLEDFEKHSKERIKDYTRRGYPMDILLKACDRARQSNRPDLLAEKTTKKQEGHTNRIPLIVTHNPANPNLNKIINKHWHLVEKCNNNQTFLDKPLVAYRRNKSLSDKLVRAKWDPNPTKGTTQTTSPCKTPWKCNFCPKKSNTGKYTSSVTGRTYTGPTNYTCRTQNVVYLITCKQCKEQYVGETYRTFGERMKEHMRYIQKPWVYNTPTGDHFNLPNHSSNDFQCQVIHILNTTPIRNDKRRTNMEESIIDRLKTRKPRGMNDKSVKHTTYN